MSSSSSSDLIPVALSLHKIGYMWGGDGPGVGRFVSIPALNSTISVGYCESRISINPVYDEEYLERKYRVHVPPPFPAKIVMVDEKTIECVKELIEAKNVVEKAKIAYSAAQAKFLSNPDAGILTRWMKPYSPEDIDAQQSLLRKEAEGIVERVRIALDEYRKSTHVESVGGESVGGESAGGESDSLCTFKVKNKSNYFEIGIEVEIDIVFKKGLPVSIFETIDLGSFKKKQSSRCSELNYDFIQLYACVESLKSIIDADLKIVDEIEKEDNAMFNASDPEYKMHRENKKEMKIKEIMEQVGGKEYLEKFEELSRRT